MTDKVFLCLANSRKIGDRCVAGKEVVGTEFGDWLRPVSARAGREVILRERWYQDRSDPQVGDLVRAQLLHPEPEHYHVENWVLDAQYFWENKGRATWDQICAIVDNPTSLWGTGQRTAKGFNDQIDFQSAQQLTSSLCLVSVQNVNLHVITHDYQGKVRKRLQARFFYRNAQYWLWVTDPPYEFTYLQKDDGLYQIGPALLTISLSEPMAKVEGGPLFVYKLVAAILQQGNFP